MKKFFCLLSFSLEICALPQNPAVMDGEAQFAFFSNELEVQALNGTIIHWDEFSIQEAELARFLLPSTDSSVVNRVLLANPSEIMGRLESNGRVVLINPNGILVGKEAQINLGSFIASTLDLHKDFKVRFAGTGGNVENRGTILALGDVAMIGSSVIQGGSIIANNVFAYADNIELPVGSLTDVAARDLFGSGGQAIFLANEKMTHLGTILAQGGSSGGDGGFVEISGSELIFRGDVSTMAPFGKTGTLLLDPNNITISAGVTNPGPPPGVFYDGAGTANAVLNNVDLQNALALNNVVVQTNIATAGGSGDITVNAPILWSAQTSLTLNAFRHIVVNARILQNAAAVGANLVNLQAGGNITINQDATVAPLFCVSVGSRNDGTSIQACGDVILAPPAGGPIGGGRSTQIGFYIDATTGLTATGNISVCCNNLFLNGHFAEACSQIGHGRPNALGPGPSPPAAIPINASGNILVQAAGNVSLICLPPNLGVQDGDAVIGHGAHVLPTAAGTSLTGDITVECGGNLLLDAHQTQRSVARIGHGQSNFASTGVIAATACVMDGDIQVFANGNIQILGGTILNGLAAIGHHQLPVTGTAGLDRMDGDIFVSCNGNLDIVSGASGANCEAFIGNWTPVVTNTAVYSSTGNYQVSVGGNLNMTVSSPFVGRCFIGGFEYNSVMSTTVRNNILDLAVGGNLNITGPAGKTNSCGIGFRCSEALSTTDLFLAVNGNMTLNGTNLLIQATDNVNCAIGGDLNITNNGASMIVLGTAETGATATRLFVQGSINETLSSTGPIQIGAFANDADLNPLSWTDFLDVRAGGNIQWTTSFGAAITNGISIQAGHSFQPGELWTSVNPNLTTICGQTLLPTFLLNFPLNFTCTGCAPTAFNIASVLVNSSPAFTSTCGGFSVAAPAASLPLTFTTTGNLTLSSFCDVCNNAPDLSLGTGAGNQINVTSPLGSVSIIGFHDLSLNQAITTNSSFGANTAVQMSACNDFTVAAGSNILSTASGAQIFLTADDDSRGNGILNINANITSTDGDICLASGPGTFGCGSNNCRTGGISGFPVGNCAVNINAGTVNAGAGAIHIVSASDILIDGAATSVQNTGNLTLTAGLGNINILKQVKTTGGPLTTFAGNDTNLTQTTGPQPLISGGAEIRMITGHNMTLNPNTAIASTGGEVTLIVDNNHPTQPAFPSSLSGKFTMLAGTSVKSGSPLRIFTAYSQAMGSGTGINFIDPTALLNNQSPSAFGYPGTLFQDTATEVWCTFFGCPANYPFPALGVPFTIFYKNCLDVVVQQAATVVVQLEVYLHPYNEFPGWMERFWVKYAQSDKNFNPNEPYYLRRRHLNVINQPKTWTVLSQIPFIE
ncbi:MAG: filamentous hemagglutinin N-terminal domain-containing protein [Parachlamydiales bacterium]|nr:filamentous hemagglutinin N-terminal domain-containing protein [Parachlamydiales bacterium]